MAQEMSLQIISTLHQHLRSRPVRLIQCQIVDYELQQHTNSWQGLLSISPYVDSNFKGWYQKNVSPIGTPIVSAGYAYEAAMLLAKALELAFQTHGETFDGENLMASLKKVVAIHRTHLVNSSLFTSGKFSWSYQSHCESGQCWRV